MKITIKLLSMFIISLFVLSACATHTEAPEVSHTTNAVESIVEQDDNITTVRAIIDIYDNYWGQYCLSGEVNFYYNEEIKLPDYIWIDNPSLLTFRVGEEFNGGIGIIDGDSIKYVLSCIQDYMTNAELNYDDTEMFKNIFNLLNNAVIVEGHST